MNTKEEVIAYLRSELTMSNCIVWASLGNGGSGTCLSKNGEEAEHLIRELNEYTFEGEAMPCKDLSTSRFYKKSCKAYQFTGDNGYYVQVLV